MTPIERSDPSSDPTSDADVGSFAARLQEVIGAGSVREFAIRIGVSEGTLRNLLKGGDPKLSTVLRIAAEAGVTVDWLTGCQGSTAHEAEAVSQCVCKDEFDEEYILVPGYHVQVSTGNGCVAPFVKESIKRRLAFRRKYLDYRQLRPENLAVVFSKGDSMEPTIKDNDSLLINLNSTTPKDGKIFVVRLGDDLYAKRIQRLVDGGIMLISDNKEYPAQTIDPSQLEQLQVIGQVIWIGKDV